MRLMQMLQEGGWLAWLALLLGVGGTLVGAVALMLAAMKSRAAFGLGVTALILSTLAAGAGIAGTITGKRNVEAALAYVASDVDRDHILRAGHREASTAAVIGAWAAGLPLLLGVLAAMLGARAGERATRRQGLEAAVSTDESSSRSVVGLVFAGIAALAASGAWVTGHRPPPMTKYDFADEDQSAWSLAGALEDLEKKNLQKRDPLEDPQRGCTRLSEALEPYWGASNRTEWPRQMKPIPPSLAVWRAAADGCAREQLDGEDSSDLLTSPLLQDDALHAAVVAKAGVPNTAAMNDVEEEEEAPSPSTVDQKTRIATAVRKARGQVQACYERGLVKQPKLEGTIEVHLSIGATGAVSAVSDVSKTAFDDPTVVACVVKQLKAVKFGPSPDGQPVEVKYPFVFKVAK